MLPVAWKHLVTVFLPIVITLLALDLKVPRLEGPTNASHLLAELLNQCPVYLAFVTSFATVLIMWVHHHAIFEGVHKSSRTLKFTNGLLLMLITAVPFSTALLSEYPTSPAGSVAAAVYAGLIFWIDLCYNLVWCQSKEYCLTKVSMRRAGCAL
jgi:uncharacterized membrane protein